MKKLLSVLSVLPVIVLCCACKEKTDPTIPVTSVTITPSSLTLDVGEKRQLEATVLPENATDQTAVWSSSDEDVAVVSVSGLVIGMNGGPVTITATCGGMSATCATMVKKVQPAGAVDLGLPSGLFWASCNLGASKPEDDGDFYAWGETDPKSNYSWTTYKFRTSGDMDGNVTLSKYTSTDGLRELQRGENTGEEMDDAARKRLGGRWRMPTEADFTELINNTAYEWTTYNGKEGFNFISKTNSGNWIFFPAAGSWDGATHYNAGTTVDYWSSSRSTLSIHFSREAYEMINNYGVPRMSTEYRNKGLPVRAVSD